MFKQAITSIYERERERQVQMEREFNERIGMETLQAFRRLCDRLGVAADGASVNGYRVQIDGVTLEKALDPDGWKVVGTCPVCGESAVSSICYDLTDLARAICDFTPGYLHECKEQPTEVTSKAVTLTIVPDGDGVTIKIVPDSI